jgi:Na+-driven multidrug efflux pump
MRIGIYQSVESLIFQFGRTITYRSFTGSVDIAANSVTGSIFNIASAPGNSLSIVAMALVGRLSGAGDKKQSYKVLRNIILMAMVMLFLTHVIFFPVFPLLISLYTGNFDPANLVLIRATIYKLMILNVVFMPLFWPASFILIAGMKGAGDVRFTSAVSITSMWLVRVLFAYVLGDLFGMGVVGVWLGMFFDWVARGIFAFIRFRSKKWQENVVI